MLTAFDTVAAIRERRISAQEVVTECAAAIETLDSEIHAMVSVDAESALAQAATVDERVVRGGRVGPLAGLPVALKDNICMRRGRTTCSSRMLEHYQSPYDAHVVERLEAAGAIVLAKTNLDEFAMGSSTEHSAFFTTRNPWDRARVAGGSSGGSAAAVASRMVPAAFGSDTGGSVRQPAAHCGVVGLKPTYGRVSRYGLVAFGSSLDQIGPMARDVRDVALLLSVIAGRDHRDSTSADAPVPDYGAALDQPLAGVRIGVVSEYATEGMNEAVRVSVDGAMEVLRGGGAELVEVHMPHLKYAVAAYYVIATAEASSNLARYDGVRFGHRGSEGSELADFYSSTRREGFGAEVKRRIMLGTYVLSSGYYDAYYLKAQKTRTLIRGDFEKAFSDVDVIAMPVSPTTAFVVGEKVNDPLSMVLADVFTTSANLSGVPGISVPCGFDDANLPIGLQLLGPWFGEERLLAIAHQYQLLTDYHTRMPLDLPSSSMSGDARSPG